MREEDVLASVSVFIHDTFSTMGKENHVPIDSARNLEEIIMDDQKRVRGNPYFGVGLVRRQTKLMATRIFYDFDRWVIIYLGEEEKDVRKKLDILSRKLITDKRILGYFHNYIYDSPRIYCSEPETDIPETHTLAFTAIREITNDPIPYETLLSEDIEIKLDPNYFDSNTIKIQFPKVPAVSTIFNKYKMWLKDGDEYKYVSEWEQGNRDINLRIELSDMSDIQATDVIYVDPEEIDCIIPYRYMEVRDAYTDMSEDRLEDKFWKGVVLLDIESPLVLLDENEPVINFVDVKFDPPIPHVGYDEEDSLGMHRHKQYTPLTQQQLDSPIQRN